MPIARRWTADIHLSDHPEDKVMHPHAKARPHTRDATDLRGRREARNAPGERRRA